MARLVVTISNEVLASDHHRGAVLRVRILDTTMADGAAIEVAKREIDLARDTMPIDAVAAPVEVDFDLRELGVSFDPRRDYLVSAHVDQDSTGEIAKGDLLTTIAYPVPSALYGRENDDVTEQLEVSLQRI